MTELNELYGQAKALPSPAPMHLDTITDNLNSFPDGERSPGLRIWTKPTSNYMSIDGLSMREMQWDFNGIELLSINSSQLERFPDLSRMTTLEDLHMELHEFTHVPSLSALNSLGSLTLSLGIIESIESLAGLVNLWSLRMTNNRLRSLPPLTGLTALQNLNLSENQLTQLPDLSEANQMRFLLANNNQLTAEAIDSALIQLDATNTMDNGQFNYSGNPGAPEGQRSAAAAAAKVNLMGRGWIVTV